MCAQKITKRVWSMLSSIFNISPSQGDAEDVREKSSPISPPLIFLMRVTQMKHCTLKLVWSSSLLWWRCSAEAQRWLKGERMLSQRMQSSPGAIWRWFYEPSSSWSSQTNFTAVLPTWPQLAGLLYGAYVPVSARLQPRISLKIVVSLG